MDGIERFVVSTGRSGSTLLSKMLDQNTNLLSLSEFLGAMDHFGRFQDGPVSGDAFVGVLFGATGVGLMMPPGVTIKDVYTEFQPTPDDLARWGVSGSSALFAMALPSLSDDPIALMDEIVTFCHAMPTRTIVEQYRALWGWLCERLGRQGWVERTGANLRWLPEQYRAFPDARYLLIHRDGLETALSMQNHQSMIAQAEAFEHPPTTDEIERAIRSRVDGTEHPYRHFYDGAPPPVERFGRYWSYLVSNGFQGFRHMSPSQLMDVRFEDLTADTASTLQRISDFFELPADEGWIDRAAALVTGERTRPRLPTLSDEEQARLRFACLDGQVLLGQAGPEAGQEVYYRIRDVMAVSR